MQKMLSIIANVLRGPASKNVGCFYIFYGWFVRFNNSHRSKPICRKSLLIICENARRAIRGTLLTLPASELGNASASAT